jgi:hypothetical protein
VSWPWEEEWVWPWEEGFSWTTVVTGEVPPPQEITTSRLTPYSAVRAEELIQQQLIDTEGQVTPIGQQWLIANPIREPSHSLGSDELVGTRTWEDLTPAQQQRYKPIMEKYHITPPPADFLEKYKWLIGLGLAVMLVVMIKK